MDLFPLRDVPLAPDAAPTPPAFIGGSPLAETSRARAALEVCLCSGLPTQVLVAVGLTLAGIASRDAQGHLSLTHIAMLSLLDSALVIGLVVLFLRAGGERPRNVLLGSRPWLLEALAGIAIVPIVFLLVAISAYAIVKLAPWLHQPENPLATLLSTRTGLVVFAIIGVVAGGLREEIQRAFVLHRFEQRLGGAVAGLIVFSFIFGIGHSLQGWAAVFITGLLGAFWGLVYLTRRSIVAPTMSHALFNLLEVVGFSVLQ